MRHSAFMRLTVGLALTFIIVMTMIFAVVYFVMAGDVESARKAGDAIPNLAPAGDLFLSNLFAILLGAALASAVIAVVGSIFLSRWLVSRIVAVNSVAAAVREGDLAARVPGADNPDEFGELAANVNLMLDRIERLVAGMRDVSDRIAHELRTPLTRLRAQVQKLNAVPPASPEAANARAAIADEIGTTVAIFDALLDIATTESEAGDQTRLKIVNLSDVVESVVDLYDAVAEESGIALSVEAPGPAEMLGDGGLLTRMLANVVDNAIKFSPPGGRVAIRLTTEGRSHMLSVTDSGPGLAPDIRDRAFERFARGAATASVPGHGLGLAVVKAIAVRHGIHITLRDAKPGLSVTFTCPALSQ